jgi:hypothetical protein
MTINNIIKQFKKNLPCNIKDNMSNLKQTMDSYMLKITDKQVEKYDKHMDVNWLKHRDDYVASHIPTTNTYFTLLEHNYTSAQLKSFAKHYKIKTSGTKKELAIRLFSLLYFTSFAIKIQKHARGHLMRLFNNKLHGPACFKRSLCVNDSDFMTMEDLKSVPPMRFFSFKDVDGFVYGFETISLYNLITKSAPANVLNPYNRNEIPKDALDQFKTLIYVGKVLKLGITLELEPIVQTVEESLNFRILDLFQHMNALGNYSDPVWFKNLDKYKSIRFVRELYDIWHYRLQISHQTKCAICPPNGSPFNQFSMLELREEPNMIVAKNAILNLLFKMVTTGIDRDSKCLGAYYVLGALTLVNDLAAQSLPWLHQSMSYS